MKADTLNMDPEQVVRAITPRTKTLMPVHLYSHACEMYSLRAWPHSTI